MKVFLNVRINFIDGERTFTSGLAPTVSCLELSSTQAFPTAWQMQCISSWSHCRKSSLSTTNIRHTQSHLTLL